MGPFGRRRVYTAPALGVLSRAKATRAGIPKSKSQIRARSSRRLLGNRSI